MSAKEKLKDAFFELYQTKKIEKISIREITALAGYNRGTFYAHYTDIYDLLEQAEAELIVEFQGIIGEVMGRIMQNSPSAIEFFPFAFFHKNKKYLKILLGVNGDSQFVYKIKSMLKNTFMARLAQMQVGEDKHADFIFEYVASAQLGIITYWMEHEDELTIEELADMVLYIMNYGPFTYLRKETI